MYDFWWRADIVSIEPEPSNLYDSLMPTLLFSRVPLSFLVPLFTFVPFISMAVFLLSSGPLVTGVGLFHVYSTPSSPMWTSRFPLFGSWHFLTWPLFSPLSLPLLVSSVAFLVHLFYNPLLFLYLIFLTFTIPTQGTPFVKLLEVISVSLDFLDLPQYLRYAKVHSEGGACQKEGREE